ncbi:MAG: SDR family NAD(P)-dependent oxidoreductase [Alphaproteobacteria bacterium]|jgi:NAD(P)-dependent dehydrogenase (short-subunit alcohol dehydrogenase family)
MSQSVLIVGAGSGLSASLARRCHAAGMKVALAARDGEKARAVVQETGASLHRCDASSIEDVAALFAALDAGTGTPDLVVYNPSARLRGPITELDPEATRAAIETTCFGAFLVAQQAARQMLARGSGSILFTGASAGVKGFANSSVFAMGKFGLRGLAQSLARELHPQNIHIGHFVIDGGIASDRPDRQDDGGDQMLDPDAIAEAYLQFHNQHRSAWAWEVELRPWVETF